MNPFEQGTAGRKLVNCANAVLTGITIDGGYAEVMMIDARSTVTIPDVFQMTELLVPVLEFIRAGKFIQLVALVEFVDALVIRAGCYFVIC